VPNEAHMWDAAEQSSMCCRAGPLGLGGDGAVRMRAAASSHPPDREDPASDLDEMVAGLLSLLIGMPGFEPRTLDPRGHSCTGEGPSDDGHGAMRVDAGSMGISDRLDPARPSSSTTGKSRVREERGELKAHIAAPALRFGALSGLRISQTPIIARKSAVA
jgi:hypothetical protein